MSARKVVACGVCGDTSPQCEGWIDMNTNKPTGDDSGSSTFWCPSCDEHYHFGNLVTVTRKRAAKIAAKHEADEAARPKCPGCGLPEGDGHYANCRTVPKKEGARRIL